MLSIIIPAHNEQDYISNTINSIKKQKFTEYEIITVLDGCTDNTLNQVRNKADKIVVLRTRKGPAIAKNEGAKRAKGDVLVFLDADTQITEGLLKIIEEKKNDYVVGTALIRPSNDKLKHKIFMWLKNKISTPLGVSNGIIFCRKEVFDKTVGFPIIKKGEDGKFVRSLLKNSKFFIAQNYVISSTRRFDKKGYLAVMIYWVKEWIKPSKEDYEIIR